MNKVFLIGTIINNIEFKFIINSKNISVAKFTIKTEDKQEIKIEANNEVADFAYSKLEKDFVVLIEGYISKNIVKALKIAIFSKNKQFI